MDIVEKNLLTNTLKVWRAEIELLERIVSTSMDLLVATEKAVERVFPDSVVYGTAAYFGNDDKAGDAVPPSDAECEASAETESAEDPSAVLYNGEEIPLFSEPGSGS